MSTTELQPAKLSKINGKAFVQLLNQRFALVEIRRTEPGWEHIDVPHPYIRWQRSKELRESVRFEKKCAVLQQDKEWGELISRN